MSIAGIRQISSSTNGGMIVEGVWARPERTRRDQSRKTSELDTTSNRASWAVKKLKGCKGIELDDGQGISQLWAGCGAFGTC